MAADVQISQMIAQTYDAVPYPGLAVARAQPDFLEVVARLRGLSPTPARRARVLEIGCASGQNLLPLAERYPEASFVGIDISQRQIQDARRIAAELSLSNVEFRPLDIVDFTADETRFDYIIAHGVYSWVTAPARDRLLAICHEQLADHGVAFISYKAYPGWRVHDVFRHTMFFDSRNARNPAERMQKSRQVIEFFQQCFTEKRAYDQLIHEELAGLTQLPDPYLWHDHLAPLSHPVMFKDFMAHAGRHQLQHLGEATFGVRPIDQLDAETEQHLAALTSDPVQQEQLRDVIRNRAIRQALLVRQSAAVSPMLETERIQGLFLSAAITPESSPVDLRADTPIHFTTAAGGRVSTPVQISKAALLHLGEIWPASIEVEALVRAASSRVQAVGLPAPDESEVQRLKDNLVQCIVGQIVHASSGPDAFVARVSERPMASPVARLQAAQSDIVASRRHHPVRFDALDRVVLTLLDGSRDSVALVEELIAANQRGQLVVTGPNQAPATPEEVRKAFTDALPISLQRLMKHALLVA